MVSLACSHNGEQNSRKVGALSCILFEPWHLQRSLAYETWFGFADTPMNNGRLRIITRDRRCDILGHIQNE
jgi:hypothetical protein